MMYVCFMVFQRFLLRIWSVMISKNTPRRRFWIDVYFWVFTAIYFSSQVFNTTAICVDYTLANSGNEIWSDIFTIKSVVIITTMLTCHLLISLIVLPEFKKRINYNTVTWYAIIVSIFFAGIMFYREYIVFEQDKLKKEHPSKFNIVMITYFACFEMVFMVFIIGEIFH